MYHVSWMLFVMTCLKLMDNLQTLEVRHVTMECDPIVPASRGLQKKEGFLIRDSEHRGFLKKNTQKV